jgi:transposase
MPPLTDEKTRGNVVREWILGFSRDTIAKHYGIGAGTVSSIIANYKTGLEELDFDSIRQLAVEAKQHGLKLSELASHARLYNFFVKSGASENAIESFITKVSSSDVSPEQVIELVYQLHEISEKESIPLDQVSEYIKQKIQEKQKIDEYTKEAEATLRNKNVSIEAINEYIQLKKELKKYRLSTKDIHRLLDVLVAAKEYRYSPGKIVAKLRNIKRLENKENKLKTSCEAFSKKEANYKEIIPYTEEIVALHIGIPKLIGLEVAIKEAAKMYNLPFFHSTVRLIEDIKAYNKLGGLKKELDRLSLQKSLLDQACSRQGQSLIALAKLKSNGITEDKILELNSYLENNGYKTDSYTSNTCRPEFTISGKH